MTGFAVGAFTLGWAVGVVWVGVIAWLTWPR